MTCNNCVLSNNGLPNAECIVDGCKFLPKRTKTNADYIRNMTDDELTTFLASIDHYMDEGECIVVFEGEPMHDNIIDIEEWLKEERKG